MPKIFGMDFKNIQRTQACDCIVFGVFVLLGIAKVLIFLGSMPPDPP